MKERKYLIVDSETGEVIKEKSSVPMWRRALAFLFLFVCYVLMSIVASLTLRFVFWCISELSVLSVAFRVFIYLLLGTTILGIIFAPLFYGVPLAVALCEAIAPTRKGKRYKVWGTIAIIHSIFVVFSNLAYANSFPVIYVYMALFSIFTMLHGIATTSEASK